MGVEPAIKPAVAQSKTGRIGVIGTRGTVTSAKFQALLATVQPHADFVVQPCDGLAAAIEGSVVEPDGAFATKTRALCDQYISAMGTFGSNPGQMDTLVLGCTHYVFAAPYLRSQLGETVQLIDTGAPVARQTRRLLAAAQALSSTGTGQVQLIATGEAQNLHMAAVRWLALHPARTSGHVQV